MCKDAGGGLGLKIVYPYDYDDFSFLLHEMEILRKPSGSLHMNYVYGKRIKESGTIVGTVDSKWSLKWQPLKYSNITHHWDVTWNGVDYKLVNTVNGINLGSKFYLL